jgi:hypothetical protein
MLVRRSYSWSRFVLVLVLVFGIIMFVMVIGADAGH